MDTKRDYVMDIIALIIVVGFFIMCFEVLKIRLDPSDHDIIYMLMGQLTAGFVLVISYYFGSSKNK